MFRIIALTLFVSLCGGAASAQIETSGVPERRAVFERNVDLVGTDLSNIFDTTLPACQAACFANDQCEAITFNRKSNACFPKRDITGTLPFDGALSGYVLVTSPDVMANVADRIAELDFLNPRDLELAKTFVAGQKWLNEDLTTTRRDHLNRALRSDTAYDWLVFSRSFAASNSGRAKRMTFRANVVAYLRAQDPELRRDILTNMATSLERVGRGRDMISALRAAQTIRFSDDTARALDTAIGKYGFRVVDTKMESDAATPRFCAVFSEGLIKAGQDYTPYVQLPKPQLVVATQDQQICVDGVEHGERYRIVLRQGLPAASGEALNRDVELDFYVRDRSPSVKFTSRAYILPRVSDVAIPIETVNTNVVDLTLYQIDDRNILRSIQNDMFGKPLSSYSGARLSDEIGTQVWTGTVDTASDLNRDILTRVPLGQALDKADPGLYVLTAKLDLDDRQSKPATQWFIVSDLGVSTYLGQDGLTVALRSLADTDVIQAADVSLVSRSNAVLATQVSDDRGIVQFPSGMTQGRGGNAPAMVVVKNGNDISFLSLKDPAFDLSDRGVSGREPGQAMDVFITADRGAYRAGDTIHVTALLRDTNARALHNVPLTAVLMRPDGVEYGRVLSANGQAGGHVFDLPVQATAPRGTWRISVFADVNSPALARTSVLVEDFVPERIDFEMTLPEMIELGGNARLGIAAKYLFGPAAAGAQIEGDVVLRGQRQIAAYPGYRFGRFNQRISPEYQYLSGTKTDPAGLADIDLSIPMMDVSQPLQLQITARLSEASGRPVERRIQRTILPKSTMIGIKPQFDGVLEEGGTAKFSIIAVTPNPVQIQWTINKVSTRYQWYLVNGSWNWDPITTRTRVATGAATLHDEPVAISSDVDWGRHELIVETTEGRYVSAATRFDAGWYASASSRDTPDVLTVALDADSYGVGDTATLRMVPRHAGVAVISVMSDRLISMTSKPVVAGENTISLPVTADWGAGVYVSATVVRSMDVAAQQNPTRAIGLAHASVEPGDKALDVNLQVPAQVQPRQPMDVAVQVNGVAPGDTAFVTLAAVDLGILNITQFSSPDPQGHYFGQRKLGVELRDVYGRLIHGLNGAMGTVRSGGDGEMGDDANHSPPPTEDLVALFSGPVAVDANGIAHVKFDVPAFNGTLRLMAVAWSDAGVGQAAADIVVRDPIVLTGSLPRFAAPGDQSRVLLNLVHADGPAGEVVLDMAAEGVTLHGATQHKITLAPGQSQTIEVPFVAQTTGEHSISVNMTTPSGTVLTKNWTLPVVMNDPQVSKTSRFVLDPGQVFSFDDSVFANFAPGSGTATVSLGPLARFDVPGLLNHLDRYPYGCTEQLTSRAMPLLDLNRVATAMGLGTDRDIREQINTAVMAIISRQTSNGSFGLWYPRSGDLWLDAYVTDFLTRASAQGYDVPNVALETGLSNLRNAVNYYPDFDQGGADLAYALYVLARQGDVAIGDLRYFADEKVASFTNPVAHAHLGAALAQFGDRGRSDAMFAAAARGINLRRDAPEGAIWRRDYGSYRRDDAAILALAIEAGTDSISRNDLARYLARPYDRVSTQEAAWTLRAAHALIDDQSRDRISVNGVVHEGPLVHLRSVGQATLAMKIENTGTTSTEVTVTSLGVPNVPALAGGNGYAIKRAYYNMDGTPMNSAVISAGTRLVTVLTVTPFGRQEARLMVNDPLPAGFEIDNPNLIRGGDIAALNWLKLVQTERAQFLTDRFLAAVDWRSDKPFQLAYIVRAVSPGAFHHPAASVEDMYRPQMRANSNPGRVTILQ